MEKNGGSVPAPGVKSGRLAAEDTVTSLAAPQSRSRRVVYCVVRRTVLRANSGHSGVHAMGNVNNVEHKADTNIFFSGLNVVGLHVNSFKRMRQGRVMSAVAPCIVFWASGGNGVTVTQLVGRDC